MENAIRQVLFELIESWLVLSYTLQYVMKTNKEHCEMAYSPRACFLVYYCTVEALVSDHLGNSKKWSYGKATDRVAYESFVLLGRLFHIAQCNHSLSF